MDTDLNLNQELYFIFTLVVFWLDGKRVMTSQYVFSDKHEYLNAFNPSNELSISKMWNYLFVCRR